MQAMWERDKRKMIEEVAPEDDSRVAFEVWFRRKFGKEAPPWPTSDDDIPLMWDKDGNVVR